MFKHIFDLLNNLYLCCIKIKIMAKKITVTKSSIIASYMNYILEHNQQPKTPATFATYLAISEKELYSFFGSLAKIEQELFSSFCDKTVELLNQNEAYEQYDEKGKLLSFYFTFFELLTANKTVVSFCLNQHKNILKNAKTLTQLRQNFNNYSESIAPESVSDLPSTIQNFKEKATKEYYWMQLVATLHFWLNDDSLNFEKTDLFIEKGLKVTFDLKEHTPLESLLDFGKFLFKEKMQK